MPRSLIFFLVLMALIIWLQAGSSDEVIDLGVARYPAQAGQGGESAKTTQHVWRADGRGAPFRLSYAYGDAAAAKRAKDHQALGTQFSFTWATDETFEWRAPKRCEGREWSCIYDEVLARGKVDVEPILERIEAGFADQSWTTTDAARWLLSFVQEIPYELPTQSAFGVLPPALVASEYRGDCDSKSLLLIHLLDRLGIDSVLVISHAHAHALVAIDVPAKGKGYRYRGREYAWAETTAVSAPLGWIHPGMRLPFDWEVVPLR